MRQLDARDIRRLRMQNQWLTPRPDVSAVEVVRHMGALQAQEVWSGHWSIASRSGVLTDADVHDATVDRQILRTWPMRGTIHFVPARDADWMLDLAATSAFKGVERRRAFLGLSESDALAAVEILREALADGEPLERSGCVEILETAGLIKDRSHIYHLLWFAAQNKATCIGPQHGKEQTFVNLSRWVDSPNELSRDEALAKLAYSYFDSHGPADRKEFARWTGLPAADARRGIDLASERLAPVQTDFGEMLVSSSVAEELGDSAIGAPEKDRAVLLLSGFDEYVLGYGDRSTMMSKDQLKLVIPGGNGIFRPTIVDDGTVVGTWKRALKKTRVDITLAPFAGLNKRQLKGVERAAGEYGEFIGLEPNVITT